MFKNNTQLRQIKPRCLATATMSIYLMSHCLKVQCPIIYKFKKRIQKPCRYKAKKQKTAPESKKQNLFHLLPLLLRPPPSSAVTTPTLSPARTTHSSLPKPNPDPIWPACAGHSGAKPSHPPVSASGRCGS